MSARAQQVGEIVMECMDEIARHFRPGVKVTVIVRTPTHPDGSRDMVVTADELPAVIAALKIREVAR